jgi:hypothetical protein
MIPAITISRRSYKYFKQIKFIKTLGSNAYCTAKTKSQLLISIRICTLYSILKQTLKNKLNKINWPIK